MNIYTIPDKVLGALRDLRRRRDEQAMILGTAHIEHDLRKTEILMKFRDIQERDRRLGALQYDFDMCSNQCMRLIRVSVTDQKGLGEPALRALGLDPDKEELSIDLDNGAVMVLRDAAWLPYAKE